METTTRPRYPSDLTDTQGALIQDRVPGQAPLGCPITYQRREVVNALLYVARTGCQWRALPHDFPPWVTVYWYFRTWKKDGTFDRLMAELRGDLRVAEGRQRQPSAAVIDSQSVKTTEKGGSVVTMAERRSPAASGTSW